MLRAFFTRGFGKAVFGFSIKPCVHRVRALDGSHLGMIFEKRKSIFGKAHAHTEDRPAALRRLGDDGQGARRAGSRLTALARIYRKDESHRTHQDHGRIAGC